MAKIDVKTKRYAVIKNRLALLEPLVSLAFLAVIQMSGASSAIKDISYNISSRWYAAIAIYAVLFTFSFYIVTFWLSFYRGFIVEHRFGLSNQSLSSWAKDELKQIILSLLLFFLFVEFFYFLLRSLGDLWWFFAAIGWVLFTIVFVKLLPILIIPLFFKYEPLGDNDLKERVGRMASKCGIKILAVSKIKLSAKTKKGNAALVGIGKTRRVLLGDTLLNNYTKEEIEVVLAHELAHHKLGHLWKLLLAGGASTFLILFLVSRMAASLIEGLHLGTIDNVAAFPSIIFLFLLFSLLISPLQNAFSRKLESSADLMALKITGMPAVFASCMNKLAKQNLADPAPSKFIELILYDHPPISKRIRMAESYKIPAKLNT